jgi:hypothetical protein
MKQIMAMMFLVLGGCSTAPVADLLDHYQPGQIEHGSCYGGVAEMPQTSLGPPSTSPLPPVPARAP